MFSCEFCGIFKNTIFTEHLWATVSVSHHINVYFQHKNIIVPCFEKALACKKNEGQLLLTFVRPHEFVTSETVSRLRFCPCLGLILLFLRFIQQYCLFCLQSSPHAFLPREKLKRDYWSKGSTFQKLNFRGVGRVNVSKFKNQF